MFDRLFDHATSLFGQHYSKWNEQQATFYTDSPHNTNRLYIDFNHDEGVFKISTIMSLEKYNRLTVLPENTYEEGGMFWGFTMFDTSIMMGDVPVTVRISIKRIVLDIWEVHISTKGTHTADTLCLFMSEIARVWAPQ